MPLAYRKNTATNTIELRGNPRQGLDWHKFGRTSFADSFVTFDDFEGAVISSRWGFPTKGSDAATANFAVNVQKNGVVRATTGAGAGGTMAVNGVAMYSGLSWLANAGGLVLEARAAISAITNITVWLGFAEAITLTMPATLGAGDALTTNAVDATGFLFDTAADTDTIWLVGVANNVDAVKQNTGIVPVAATFATYRVEINSLGNAIFYYNGRQVGTEMALAVTPTVALTPYIAAFTRTAASATVDLDYIHVANSR